MAVPTKHYLKKAWLAATLAATLSTGMAPMAEAQTARQPQRHEQTQEAVYADPIQGLQAEFNKTYLGRNLLLFANQYDIRFYVDPTLAARKSKAEYDPSTGNVALRPNLTADELAMTGAHELRHGYQDKKLGVVPIENSLITPWQRWTLRRYLEGDACAYAGFFGADRMEKGIPIGAGFGKEGTAAQIAMRLRGELQFSRDGLTPAEFLKHGFEPAMSGLDIYNDNHLKEVTQQVERLERDVKQAATNPRKLQELSRRYAATPSDTSFEMVLRGFGTLAADYRPLQSVSRQTLLQDYPRLGTEGFTKTLDSEMRQLTERHNAAIGQLQTLMRKAAPSMRPAG